MENKTFIQRNKAYLWVSFGFVLLTYWFLYLATTMDLGYVVSFLIEILQGNFTGQIVPFESLSKYEQSEVGVFGPNYLAMAPEIIRAYIERGELLPYVFLAEFIAFAIAFKMSGGRKSVLVVDENDNVVVYSLFQRLVLLLNIVIFSYIFITGFSITFGEHIGGGSIHGFLRATHEVVGVAWIPIWMIVSVIAFKDHQYFVRPSSKLFYKIFLTGSYTPMKRINYFAFVIFGFVSVISGFLMWYMHPNPETIAQTIQLKRLLLYAHFAGSAIISFFVFEIIYTYVVSVKGYLPGLITGKLPKQYIEKLRPDLLEKP